MNMKEKIAEKDSKQRDCGRCCWLGVCGPSTRGGKSDKASKLSRFDVSASRVERLANQGHNYIGDVVDSELKNLVENGMLTAKTDFYAGCKADFIAICVPTPA